MRHALKGQTHDPVFFGSLLAQRLPGAGIGTATRAFDWAGAARFRVLVGFLDGAWVRRYGDDGCPVPSNCSLPARQCTFWHRHHLLLSPIPGGIRLRADLYALSHYPHRQRGCTSADQSYGNVLVHDSWPRIPGAVRTAYHHFTVAQTVAHSL